MTTLQQTKARTRAIEWHGATFLFLGLALGALLISSRQTLYSIQNGAATFASLLPLGYAFAAGMVATINPCGVLLLPSLVAFYLGRGDGRTRSGWRLTGRALLFSLTATLGFVALFAVAGLVVGAGGSGLAYAFPVGGLVVGIALAVMGIWLSVSGRSLGIFAASGALGSVRLTDDLRSPFVFGVAYAVTSLACTLPIFLVVAGSALAAGDPVAAAVRFIAYALGMGTVLTTVTLGTAFFQGAVVRSLRGLVPYVHRVAASFLLGAGIFVVHYWLTAPRF